jgi:hypothetical protein
MTVFVSSQNVMYLHYRCLVFGPNLTTQVWPLFGHLALALGHSGVVVCSWATGAPIAPNARMKPVKTYWRTTTVIGRSDAYLKYKYWSDPPVTTLENGAATQSTWRETHVDDCSQLAARADQGPEWTNQGWGSSAETKVHMYISGSPSSGCLQIEYSFSNFIVEVTVYLTFRHYPEVFGIVFKCTIIGTSSQSTLFSHLIQLAWIF